MQKECRSTPFVQNPSIFLHPNGLKCHSFELSDRVSKVENDDQIFVRVVGLFVALHISAANYTKKMTLANKNAIFVYFE